MPNTKLLITSSFLELQSPDFAWKFVWTVQTKYKSTKVQKVQKSTKVLITHPFFELQDPDFAWKFIWTVQPNDKVQKYKKYKKTSRASGMSTKKIKWSKIAKVQNRKVQKI